MVPLRLLGALGAAGVGLLAIGSLLSMAMTLVGDVPALLGLGVVLVVVVSLWANGSGHARDSVYW